MAHLIPRQVGALAAPGALTVLTLAAGEWLRAPGPAAALAAVLAAAGFWLAGRPVRGPAARSTVVLAGLLATAVLAAELRRLVLDVPGAANGQRADAVVAEATRALDTERGRLERLTAAALAVDLSLPEAAFDALERLRRADAPLAAVALLDQAGRPEAWAGRFLSPPAPGPPGLSAVRTPFYVILEVRRQRPGGGTAVAASPLWRDPAIPAVAEVVSDPVVERHGGTLTFGTPATGLASAAVWPGDLPLVTVQATAPVRSEALRRHLERAARVMSWLLAGTLAAAAAAGASPMLRLLPVLLGLLLVLRAPFGAGLGAGAVFSPAWFFSPLLGPFSASAGTLAAAGIAALSLAAVVRHRLQVSRWYLRGAGMALALAAPLLMRELGRGITPSATGVPLAVWLGWHAALLMPATAMLTLAAALVRGGQARGRAVWPVAGGAAAVLAAVLGVLVFTGRPGWPAWYLSVWVPVVLLVIRPAPFWASMLAVALAAGSGTALMTWGNALAARTDLALSDVATLGRDPDPLAEPRLTDLAAALAERGRVPDAPELYRAWRTSGLRRERYPTRLMVWAGRARIADVALDAIPLPDSVLADLAAGAPPGQRVMRVAAGPGVHHVLTRRLDSAHVLQVAVAPRSQLVPRAVLGRLLENEVGHAPLYRLTLSPVAETESARPRGRWRRVAWSLRASRRVDLPAGTHDVRIVIPLGTPTSIAVRGGLLLLADVALLGLLWALWVWTAGGAVRIRLPVQRRSYETRLALALAVFFITPAAVLSVVGTRQVAGEARRSRDLVLQRILRDAAASDEPVSVRAAHLDASLAVYLGGRLVESSEPVLPALGVLPPLLEPEAHHSLVLEGDAFIAPASNRLTLAGYLAVPAGRTLEPGVVATVQSAVDRELIERRQDIGLSFALATLLGVLAAVLAARAAARTLSRPVTELRETALALGRGRPARLGGPIPPREFEPVFDAFARMAADVRRGQDALEAARRRTEAVLSTVPTGVMAVDGEGRVLLANRTAEEVLGLDLPVGATLDQVDDAWRPLARRVAAGAAHPDEFELEALGRRYAIRFTPLEGAGGSVVTLNDVTVATRAARVLVWADVANQVAHAIKNPLTPLRLGIQHLQRVREQRPDQFDAALVDTSRRLLAEIDRLDAIARAFSRFGAPTGAEAPLEPVDVGPVVEEVAALHHLAPGLRIRPDVPPGALATARRDELREVLLNLCDNARNAGATEVVLHWEPGRLRVADNGRGMPPEIQGRIFEPRFSTTSSGAGLGLAIVRRLVEGWGGGISVRSRAGDGTEFMVTFPGGSTEPGPRG